MKKAAHIGGLLEQLLSSLGLEDRMQQTRALIVWDRVVGPQIAAHTRPHKIREDVLEICVDQPAWMQQLQLMKPQILKKLNAELGDAPLRDIFLRRGRMAPPPAVAPQANLPWRSIPLEATEKHQLTQMLSVLKDPALRQEMTDFLSKQLRVNKARGEAQPNHRRSG